MFNPFTALIRHVQADLRIAREVKQAVGHPVPKIALFGTLLTFFMLEVAVASAYFMPQPRLSIWVTGSFFLGNLYLAYTGMYMYAKAAYLAGRMSAVTRMRGDANNEDSVH